MGVDKHRCLHQLEPARAELGRASVDTLILDASKQRVMMVNARRCFACLLVTRDSSKIPNRGLIVRLGVEIEEAELPAPRTAMASDDKTVALPVGEVAVAVACDVEQTKANITSREMKQRGPYIGRRHHRLHSSRSVILIPVGQEEDCDGFLGLEVVASTAEVGQRLAERVRAAETDESNASHHVVPESVGHVVIDLCWV